MHKTFWLAAVAAMLWFGPAGASADLIAEINIKDGQLTFINETTGGKLDLVSYQISLSPPVANTWNTSEWLPLSGDDSFGNNFTLSEVGINNAFWSVSNGVSASLGTPFEYQNFDDLGSDDFIFLATDDDAGQINTSVRLVPEPASLALIGIGGLVLLRRRPAA
jgi:hypothetical protein